MFPQAWKLLGKGLEFEWTHTGDLSEVWTEVIGFEQAEIAITLQAELCQPSHEIF